MDKKKIFIYSLALVFIVSISFLVYKYTFSIEEESGYVFDDVISVNVNKSKLQELVVRTAYAFYDKNEYIQYDRGSLSETSSEFMFREFDVTPEDLSINNYITMDNASFLFSVYMNAMHYDFSEVEDQVNLVSGSGFALDDLVNIALDNNDVRNIYTGYTEYYTGNNMSLAFALDFKDKLELGDIIVYTEDDDIKAFLYLGDNKYMYADGMDYVSGNSDFLDTEVLHIVDDIFVDGKIDSDVEFYSIIRPVNEICDNDGNANATLIPVNSLSRIDDVFITRYTDVTQSEVYRGQEIVYTIDIKNSSDKEVTIYEVKDIIDNKLTYIDEVSDAGATVNEGTIVWNNIKVSANSSVTLSYKVKVSGEFEVGDINNGNSLFIGNTIDSSGATVKFVSDGYIMKLNDINFDIEVVFDDTQEDIIDETVSQILKFNGEIAYSTDSVYQDDYKKKIDSLSETDPAHLYSHSFIKFIYYNALGIDLGNNDGVLYPNKILNSLFITNEDGSYSRVDNLDNLDTTSQDINYVLVDGMYGGRLLKSFDKERVKMITMPHYSKITDKFSYTYQEFIPGDVICYWSMGSDGTLMAFSYMYLGSKYNSENDTYSGRLLRYTTTGISLLTGNEAMEVINNLYSTDLYVVLRPSKINYIDALEVEVTDKVLFVGQEVSIDYSRNPINSTVVDVNYTSGNSDIFEITDDNKIKAVSAGNGTLSMKVNTGSNVITKNINVVVRNKEDMISFDTDYDVDYDNKIIYVGFEKDVTNIENNLGLDDDISISLVDDEGNIVADEIAGDVNLNIYYMDILIDTYKIVFLSSDSLVYDTRDGEDVIKYFEVGTTVNDVSNLLNINLPSESVLVSIYDKNSSDAEEKALEDILCTGDILEVRISDSIAKRFVVSVIGDVNGDGYLKMSDLIRARRHFVEYVDPNTQIVQVQTGANYFSLDVNKDGNFKLSDIVTFRKRLIEQYD